MYGENDLHFTVEDGVEYQKDIGENAELIVVENANHFLQLSNPKLIK